MRTGEEWDRGEFTYTRCTLELCMRIIESLLMPRRRTNAFIFPDQVSSRVNRTVRLKDIDKSSNALCITTAVIPAENGLYRSATHLRLPPESVICWPWMKNVEARLAPRTPSHKTPKTAMIYWRLRKMARTQK